MKEAVLDTIAVVGRYDKFEDPLIAGLILFIAITLAALVLVEGKRHDG